MISCRWWEVVRSSQKTRGDYWEEQQVRGEGGAISRWWLNYVTGERRDQKPDDAILK